MDFGTGFGSFVWIGAVVGLLQIALIALVIVVLLDTRRFIAEAIPLMRRTNRWLAGREDAE